MLGLQRQDPLGRPEWKVHSPQECCTVPGNFQTFEDWEVGTEAFYTCDGGRGDHWQRDWYHMQGYVVVETTFFPWSPFKEITVSMFVESFNVTAADPSIALAAQFGGSWEQGCYADIGYGWPRFC